MIEATLRRWSAWSPGIESSDAWRVWAKSPTALTSEGRPDATFLPKLLRRRCGTLTRIMLRTAFDCCEPEELPEVTSVFGSRHGNINESIDLLDRLARKQPLSPTTFSHAVHNAQAGLFSIAAGNKQASSSIAAQQNSFACAYLEAMTMLQRDPQRPVLLIVADVPLATTFAPLVEEAPGAYGLALLLSSEGSAEARLGFDPTAATDSRPGASESQLLGWPDAIEFLRFLLSGESGLSLRSGDRGASWSRL